MVGVVVMVVRCDGVSEDVILLLVMGVMKCYAVRLVDSDEGRHVICSTECVPKWLFK